MKQFNHFRETITEGGNAVANVVRINQENTLATVEKIYSDLLPKLKIKKSDTALLGSTGKKAPRESSGDIDIALSATELLKKNNVDTYDEMMNYVVDAIKKAGYDFKDMRSIGIISIAFPIENVDGLQPNQKVQLDLMIVQSVKYAEWVFYSPHYLDSQLKGLYRNLLNFSVAKNANLVVNKIDPDTKTPIEWSRYWINNNEGLKFGTQTNISPKTGKIVKAVRTLDNKTISNNPDEIVAFLYGKKYKANDLLTFEACLKAVLDNGFPHKDKRQIILKTTAEALQREGYPIPESLEKAMK
jgi:flagellar basal body rod protein FlgB